MSKINSFLVFLLIFNLSSSFSFLNKQNNLETLCGLKVIETYTQELFGKNIGFYVKFHNSSKKSIDAIEYKITFKDGFNEVKGSKVYTWQTGNLVGPLKPNSDLRDGATNWIDNANKIEVKIIRIHFTDNTTCE